ncbi:polysaccharide pyruvyl transferase family protein [Arthrobacter sp. UKPF54-2]|uniref:polysaccharide pyruvyl transferase family protein n=1 Tax=Arthrobacter sp. UKPF54-2 TaxID=2600159 RepID=UPI0011B19C3E|nr:polysaccharide pyruvyl transferase family protein [Arthrobacter sp. UKPF54-2]QDY90638.1 polysaccharide pyruvyl transferase family protein [Arthrobacter sp. UKPF54-2]
MTEIIYLVASGGNPNYGDELIVASWLRFLARVRPDVSVWLDCPQPGTAGALFAGIHPKLHLTNALWRSCAEAPEQSAQGVWEHVDRVVSLGGTPMYDAALMVLGESETIHLLGGGYVNGVWPDHVGLVSGMLAAARLNGCRLLGTGLGLLPLPDNATQLKDAFSTFDSLSVRDAGSAAAIGVEPGLDDVFLGLPSELARSRSPIVQARAKDVMLCIQSDMTDEETFKKLSQKLRVVVEAAVGMGMSVGYVEAIPGSDRRMFDALGGLIPEENFVPFVHVWNDGLPVRPGQSWYTSRFHPHMVAAASGATGVAIGIMDDYYDVKHQSLLDLGTGWTYASARADGALPEPTGDAGFAAMALNLATRKRTEALSLYPPR